MDYHKMENITTLTCPSEDDGLGASAEGIAVGGFSFYFFSILFGGGGLTGTSSNKIVISTLVVTVLSELVFAFFEGG
jgi:methyl coenzyme M reductase beta subunit